MADQPSNDRHSEAQHSSDINPQGQTASAEKPRLQWRVIVFAFAANLLLFTLSNAVATFAFGPDAVLWASIVGPGLAGVLAAIMARQRGGMHAFIGGVASIPVMALFIIPGAWRTAIFAACFCTLGGAISEIVLRRRSKEAR